MTAFDEYFEKFRKKDITVIGVGVSNVPLIRLLVRYGARVTACDKKSAEALGDVYPELTALGVSFALGENYLSNLTGEYIFRTPGMHPENPALQAARDNGSIITSEMEAFFAVCPCKIIAVTGSDGKTTTTTLIYEILKKSGYTCHLGGNIGTPLLAKVPAMKPEDFAIVELSSFQLMTMQKSPNIAAITNLAPNHLDVHKDMEEYIGAKKNIFLHQSAGDTLVLNADDAISSAFQPESGVTLLQFSMEKPVQNGVFLAGSNICLAKDGNAETIMRVSDIKIPGRHNVANYMTAAAVCARFVSTDDIFSVAKNFGGVEHRIELVREFNGVRYYNDSIASSPTRTIAGLRSFSQKVILIAGGYDKKIPYDVIGPEILAHVKRLILVGPTAPLIQRATESAAGFAEHPIPITEFQEFYDAVCFARDAAAEGDIVLLSPASASFDRFQNFAQRGNCFKKIVLSFSV